MDNEATPNAMATDPQIIDGTQSTLSPQMAELKDWHDQTTANAKAANTGKAYARQWAAFLDFYGSDELPVDPMFVLGYVKDLSEQGKSVATIEQALSAISSQHAAKGLVSPSTHPQVKQAVKALRKAATRTTQTKQAAPLSVALVEQRTRPLNYERTYKDIRNQALILVGFFGAFRRSELAQLRWENLTETDEGFSVEIIGTKTGTVQKTLFYRGNMEACPALALKALRKRSEFATDQDFVFQSARKGDKQTGKGISDRYVDKVVKQLFGPEFSGHSLRAGFVTSARRKGATYDNIMKQTGHKTLSVVKGYARGIDNAANNAAKDL